MTPNAPTHASAAAPADDVREYTPHARCTLPKMTTAHRTRPSLPDAVAAHRYAFPVVRETCCRRTASYEDSDTADDAETTEFPRPGP
jgi:hypothetical protein